jgi:hypothetical protein
MGEAHSFPVQFTWFIPIPDHAGFLKVPESAAKIIWAPAVMLSIFW